MRAAGVTEFGGPEALHIVDVPEEHAGPGEVRLRGTAATVNPTDTYLVLGAYVERDPVKSPPWVPGMDVAGVVDEIGEGVDRADLEVGAAAMGVVVPSGAHGGYRESLVLPSDSVVRAPKNATDVEAATLPMNALTARFSLDLMGLRPGQVLAVTGAAGAYGGYVVQLAKADGLRVIADASEADEALVRELGADVVVRRGDDVAERTREVAPDGVDGLADGAGQNTLALPAIRDGGGLAAVRPFEGETERGITIHQTWVAQYATAGDKLDELGRLAEKGVITLRVAQTFPAEQASEAHRLLERGGTRGRLVIEF